MGILIGRIVLALIALVAVAAAVVTLFATAPEPERANAEPRPVAVFVEQVRSETVSLNVTTQGQARPRTQINLVPQVSGRITWVNPNFIEGGFFEAGETLIRVDDADYRLLVTRASAQVTQAEQALAREQAESDLARSEWEELGQGEASSLTLREPQLADARAQLAAARAGLQDAQLDLQRTRISAPFTGRVRTKSAGLGQYVSLGTPLGEVFSTDTVLVRLPLTDDDLGLLGIPIAYNASSDDDGIRVTLTATLAGQVQQWEGRITRTDSAIDPQTRVLYAIAEVEDPYGAAAQGGAPLAVGLFVSAVIEGRDVNGAYVLPRAALRGEDTIFVAEEGGTLDIRQVSIITSSADRVVVSDGVMADDMVVVSPIRGASTGMRIQSLNDEGEVLEAFSATIEVPEEEEVGEDDDTDGLAEDGSDDAETEAVASAG
jgi:RND family efflux transporter MFP subunit